MIIANAWFVDGNALAIIAMTIGSALILSRRLLAIGRRQAKTGLWGSAIPFPFQVRLWHIAVGVAICAVVLGGAISIQRFVHDRFSLENAQARGLRALRSPDPTTRAWGAHELNIAIIMASPVPIPGRLVPTPGRPEPTPAEADTLTDALLVALRDEHPSVREAAARALLSLTHSLGQPRPVPRHDAFVAAMAESLGDTASAVRWHVALALANIYFMPAKGSERPLPQDPGRLVEALGRVLKDPDAQVRGWAFQVLGAIAPRIGGSAPPALVAALDAPEASTRELAARAIVAFPDGHDAILPVLLRMLARDTAPNVRAASDGALMFTKLTPATVPVLVEALRSPERRVRFRAADRLSYIVPRPVEVVAELLRLLEERFEPQTQFERKHPEWTDPAVAATWALGAIAPGTPMAGRAEAALSKLLRDNEHPWRADQAREALERIRSWPQPRAA